MISPTAQIVAVSSRVRHADNTIVGELARRRREESILRSRCFVGRWAGS